MDKKLFLLVSLAIVGFLVVIVKTTSFTDVTKAAERFLVKRNNSICKNTFKNRLYTECMYSTLGMPCGLKYTLNGKVKTIKSNVVCGQTVPSRLELLRNKWLNLQPPGTSTLYCCVSEN